MSFNFTKLKAMQYITGSESPGFPVSTNIIAMVDSELYGTLFEVSFLFILFVVIPF